MFNKDKLAETTRSNFNKNLVNKVPVSQQSKIRINKVFTKETPSIHSLSDHIK